MQEQRDRLLAFDRDTGSGLTLFGNARVDITLDGQHPVREMRVFGPAPYKLTLTTSASTTTPDLSLDLSTLGDGWNRIALANIAETQTISLELTPIAGGDATALAEIEFWGDQPIGAVSRDAAMAALTEQTSHGAWRRVDLLSAADPVLLDDTTPVVTSEFDLPYLTTEIRAAYLAYEGRGDQAMIALGRAFNGQPFQGGYPFAPSEDWVAQIEEIDPTHLKAGQNHVSYALGASMGYYELRNMRLVVELATGAKIAVADATAAVLDANPASTLTVDSSASDIVLGLEKTADLEAISVSFASVPSGTVQVAAKIGSEWVAAGSAIDLSAVAAGDVVDLPVSSYGASEYRLSFADISVPFSLSEISVSGSELGATWGDSQLKLSWPLNGENYGTVGLVRGFVSQPETADGAAQVFVAGLPVTMSGGSFEALVSREQAGFGATTLDQPWSVQVTLVAPDGAETVTTVPFAALEDAGSSVEGYLPEPSVETVTADAASVLTNEGAALEVDAASVNSDVAISITPLLPAELARMDLGLKNVTRGRTKGYRMLPHMKFNKKVRIKLDYDESFIPTGYGEDDIKVYFFDEGAGRWVALTGIQVNKNANWVKAETDHFTDFIAGVVVAPESPQTANFNPTQIQGIKAADPTAKINLIEAPSASNMGDANLSYPIELPAGRLGMAPSLQLGYSSGAQNGWMGQGWNLTVPEISIDTRWGVPRYDAGFETETYSFNGQMLTPVAHRAALVAREIDREFHARIEGGFQKIIRHGSHPSNYWFEVVDKMGTRYAYGGNLDSGAIDVSAALLTDAGNVFRWKLTEVRDTNGNFVKYHYGKVASTGLKQGANPGKNIYVERITYTGHNGAEGSYEVLFTRDRELPGFAERKDTVIDGRGGFKQVTADLLRHIEVRLDGTPVRAYEFAYTEGAYHKTLLQSVTQYGADGTAFNSHSFDYHDDARNADGSYKGFAPKVSWNVPGGDVSKVSAIQGSETDSIGGFFNIGLSFLIPSWEYATLTVGAKLGGGKGDVEELLALIDIDGDGLADKVFKDGSNVSYRKNLSGPAGGGSVAFASVSKPVVNLQRIGASNSRSGDRSIEVAFVGITAGLTKSDSTTESEIYFSDVNGDGLVDLINGATVLFNTINSNGEPEFTLNVSETPYPIPDSAASADVLDVDLSSVLAAIEKASPLVDAVTIWEAPYDGQVQVTSDVELHQFTGSDRADYDTADGVRVAIQLEGAELWTTSIAQDDYTPKAANVGPLTVSKGDRIYFRVQSNYDGAYDQVAWEPHIEYVGVDLAQTDANDLPVHVYDHDTDFTLFGFGNGAVSAPKDGTVQISGTLNKTAATTDDVVLDLLVNGVVVDSHTFAAGSTGSYSISESLAVVALVVDTNTGTVTQEADTIAVRLSNDSRIDASALNWSATDTPRFTYTAFADGSDVVDGNGNPTVEVDLYSTINLMAGSNFSTPATAWTVPETGTYLLTPEVDLSAGVPDGSMVLTFKSGGNRIYKNTLSVVGGALVASQFSFDLTAGDEIWIEYADPTAAVAGYVTEARLHIELPDPLDTTAPIDNLVDELWVAELHSADYAPMAGEAHRGWLHLGYDGSEPEQPIAISEADLEGPTQAEMEALAADVQTAAEDRNEDDAIYESFEQKIFALTPEYDVARWVGQEDEIFIADAQMASSRMNNNFPSVPDPTVFVGARGVPQISVTENRNFSVGAVRLALNFTKTTSYSILDYMDVNGDGFPDILSPNGRIQYTHMLGALENTTSTAANHEAYTRRSHASNEYLSIGDGKSFPMGDKNGRLSASGSGGAYGQLSLNLGRATIGISFTPTTQTYADYDLQDVNGDGLPDLVKQDGNALKVRLSTGYSYLPLDETYGLTPLNDAENHSDTISLGFNTGLSSLSVSGSYSEGYSRVNASLNDINGDGMLDAVRRGSSGDLIVALNSGSGFESAVSWSSGGQGSAFVETNSKSLGVGGGSATGYIPVIPLFPVFYIDIGGGLNFGKTTSWSLVRISDVNGDGDPDLLRSTDDNELRVSYGTEGRTNMLKTVHRPLGSTIAMNYGVTGNTYDQPSNRWVMNRVEVYDGFDGDGSDRLVSTFAYADGYYDRQEREFYGFATVTENHLNYVSVGNETVYRTITNSYDNTSYYGKGLMLSSLTQDAAGNRYLETTNSYAFRDVHAGSAGDVASLTATIFPQLVRTDKAFYEGQGSAGKSTYTTFAYDYLGNVTRFFDAANLDTAADDVESLISYHSDPAAYIVGKANQVVVNGNGAEMRRRTAVFETGTGNLLEVNAHLANGTVSQTTLAYDIRGNLTQVQGAENLNGQRYTLDYTFDPVVQTYVTATSDSFGYGSTAEYDFRFGEVTSTTDINAQSITNTLDEFGRVLTITGPYQDADATITFAYHPKRDVPNAPVTYPAVDLSWALTQHIDSYRDLSDPIETVLFADGLGRVLQTKKDATIYQGGSYVDMMVASGRVMFDHVGRQIEQYYPVQEALGSQGVFNDTQDNVAPTVTTYDILDRPLTITIPDGSSTQMAYDFGPDREGLTQFRTLFTDAEGKMRETYADVRGLMTSVKEMNPTGGQPTIWTSYQYDPLKQITLVTDDQDNQTTASYDNLGRQIAIDSPDMGLTEFTYDPASNLIAKQTANLAAAGSEITYQYDFNRLMGVTYPEFTGNNIAYTYGAPGTSDHRANRIVTVQSQAGTEERFYGRLGETVKTILTVASDTQGNSANSPEIYTTEYTYDTWNRLQSMIYPDGEVLVNGYDSGGKLITIDGAKARFDYSYLKEMGYDKFGQRVFMRLGNDTTSTYSYTDDTRRLDTLQTHSAQTGRTFQNMTYGYDLVGNILSQANLAENADPSLLGGATAYSYQYDDLYRLVGATGSWNAPNNPESFTLSMSYDTIHNITTKTQSHLVTDREQMKTSYDWAYDYGGAQPHAPSHIGDRAFSYDANGNQTGWEHDQNGTRRTITWDEENRIQSIADNGATTTYKYNDAGERIFKVGAQGETVYVNQFYVIRGRQVGSKHIFGGAQRLVTKLASQPVFEDSTSTSSTPTTLAAPVDGNNGNGKGAGSANAHGNNPNAGGANGNGNGSGGGNGGGTGGGSGGTGTTGPQEERIFYFYHPDHLGSSSYVTDIDGLVFQHVEYFPFGETWVEEHSNRQRTPYLFTGKELDEDVQLYYFGARYYDPRTSVWQSPDPVLAGYLGGTLAGGVFAPRNLSLYSYAGGNPVRVTDPEGAFLDTILDIGFIIYDVGVLIHDEVTTGGENRTENLMALGADAAGALVPFATGGGAAVRGGVKLANRADDAADVGRAADRVDDAADIAQQGTRQVDEAADAATASGQVRFQRWKNGDAIDKPMPDGTAPSWDVVRSRYWKNRASGSSGEFSQANLDRMREGKAPLDYNPRTGNMEPRELHHVIPQRANGPNSPINLRELTPDQHGAVDPYRHTVPTTRGIQ
ncbi:SpvB/TcaC N-terminal domain-containing protein [Aliiroseovarius crassostreae]|uniref:SpvB/TcaC N-terminal domain-containing protein n=1 Tax=Aliiroseovarius crassostreae TaxID=154981 RepID=UPI00220CBA5C|nr:SpvB/TcaC N-terminal domain-containing protein [Aliiroseovarius crassostreae]UWQ09737.1 hypothetical protein K3X25_15220 [Aliiroseovarius crassostreae]